MLAKPCRLGFTLLEVLVVLTLISIIAALAVLSIPSDASAQAKHEGKKLYALLRLAQQEAILQRNRIAWESQANSYRFQQWRDGEWRAFNPDSPLRARALPPSLQLQVDVAEAPATQEGGMVLFFASGELTPFVATLAMPATAPPVVEIHAKADGRLHYAPLPH